MSALENVEFQTVGELPPSENPWHVRLAMGRVWFVNQDHLPMCLIDGELCVIVKAEENPDVPLVTPGAGPASTRRSQ